MRKKDSRVASQLQMLKRVSTPGVLDKHLSTVDAWPHRVKDDFVQVQWALELRTQFVPEGWP
jgi:hypothetical protein